MWLTCVPSLPPENIPRSRSGTHASGKLPPPPRVRRQGNNVYLSLGNITSNPKAGLLFINRETGEMMSHDTQ